MSPPQASRAWGMQFILATIVIDAMGFGIVIPVFPNLLRLIGHFDTSHATLFGGYLSELYAVFQFIFGIVMGNLSDRFGRRPVILGAMAGFAINFLLMARARNLVWLFVGQASAGIFGGTQGPAQSALADITEDTDRARVFGYVGAAFGIGFVIGPALGGVLGALGPRIPFYASSGLCTLNFLYGLLFFPETLAQKNRRRFDWRRANPLGALLNARHLQGVAMLSLVLLLWQIASLVYPMTWTYYLISAYHVSSAVIGLSFAGFGSAFAMVQIFLTGKVVRRYGERDTAKIGLACAIWTFAVFSIAPFNPWLLLLALPTMPISFTQAALSAMFSRRATP
ncbi:MAG: MFS transporter, partial [Alphaproteobacteria bacterium]|nr:MFS transporter [Alphaproteobacteria bacterium]